MKRDILQTSGYMVSSQHKTIAETYAGSDQMVMEKSTWDRKEPLIVSFVNIATREENSNLSPGGTAEILGNDLKFDIEDPEQGLFFTNGSGSVKVETIFRNKSSDLLFNIPSDLKPGNYHFEIRNRDDSKMNLKTYLYEQSLRVK